MIEYKPAVWYDVSSGYGAVFLVTGLFAVDVDAGNDDDGDDIDDDDMENDSKVAREMKRDS